MSTISRYISCETFGCLGLRKTKSSVINLVGHVIDVEPQVSVVIMHIPGSIVLLVIYSHKSLFLYIHNKIIEESSVCSRIRNMRVYVGKFLKCWSHQFIGKFGREKNYYT